MREVRKIVATPEYWESLQKSANLDAEKAASAAAERARKDALARAEKLAAEKKAYLDSIRHYDSLEFANQDLRNLIQEHNKKREEYYKLAAAEHFKADTFRKELQSRCLHKEAIETRTTYRDEYDDYHDGHYERKCIECFLIEKSDYPVGSRSYNLGHSKFHKLEKSQVVLLRKTVNGKEYELEFDDLKW